MQAKAAECNSSKYFNIIWSAWKLFGAVDLNARRYHLRSVIANVAFNIMFPLSLAVLLFSFDTPLENITNFYLMLTSLSTSMKWFVYIFKMTKIRQIESLLSRLDHRIEGAEQLRCFQKMSLQLRFITRGFTIVYSGIVIIAETATFFEKERSLPFPTYIPFDWHNSTFGYAAALLYQDSAILTQVWENMVDDLYPVVALALVAGHCELLIIRISRIGHDESVLLVDNEVELLKCIRDQRDLSIVLELVVDTISWALLTQFIITGIDLALSVFASTSLSMSVYDRAYYIFLIMGLCFQLFPVCYFGTQVKYHFEQLQYAVFSSNWYVQSKSYRKNALIFGEFIKRTPTILAGKMTPIELTTFWASCKATYSLYTLIDNTQTSEE